MTSIQCAPLSIGGDLILYRFQPPVIAAKHPKGKSIVVKSKNPAHKRQAASLGKVYERCHP